MSENRYGAYQADWDHFGGTLGLGEHLLPVVSNPKAKVSENSKMKEIGKTPSIYNRKGMVVGIPDWTSRRATAEDLAKWAGNADFGICLQTRGGLGVFDLDSKDGEKNAEILTFIETTLGFRLPMRTRNNSPKCALLFRCPGERGKRILKLPGDERLECLGNGNQLVVAGTHPSGARYEWLEGLPAAVPEIEPLTFERLWTGLCEKFGDGEAMKSGIRKQRGTHELLDDPVAEFLEPLALDTGMEGQLFIECPFSAEHTTDSGPSSTAYFPAGTRGYERGHFVCLHAHCAHRKDEDFLDALEYRIKDFDIVPAEAAPGKDLVPLLPPFDRSDDGDIKGTIPNIVKALRRPDMCRAVIRHDNFRDEITIQWDGARHHRPLTDSDYTALRLALEEGRGTAKQGVFKSIKRESIRDAVLFVADNNRYDSAAEWLTGLKWDGKPRIETFYRDYLGAEDTPYSRSLGFYQFTAMAGRVLEPGCKADMVPIWVGPQGIRKSTGAAALAPSMDYFCELDLMDRDDNLTRVQRGRLIGEFGELKGLHSRDLESIKAFITRTHDVWIPKYREFSTNYARRIFYIGTSNQDEFLSDDSGNRRWLPINVTAVQRDRIERDRDQLWAEGQDIFSVLGVCYAEAEQLAQGVHENYRLRDSWEEAVRDWLMAVDVDGEQPATRSFLQVHDVLRGALGFDPRTISTRDEWRIGKVLRVLGYKRVQKRVEGRIIKVWALPQ